VGDTSRASLPGVTALSLWREAIFLAHSRLFPFEYFLGRDVSRDGEEAPSSSVKRCR